MTFEPSPPHLRLVAQTDEQAFAQRRASDELSQALRPLAANLMRLARGSGKGDHLAEQCIAVLNAIEVHQQLLGRQPTGRDVAALLAPASEYEGAARFAAWNVAEQVVVKGALQVAASSLLHQNTQVAAGRSQMHEGMLALEKLRARRAAEVEVLQQALDALDYVIGEDDADDDDLFEPGTFLVRKREGGGFLGIFAAETAACLWDMVDEHDDPFQYEHLRLATGGLLFETRPVLNRCPDDEEEAMQWEGPFPDAVVNSNDLLDIALEDEDADWRPFDAADVGAGLIARIRRTMEERPK